VAAKTEKGVMSKALRKTEALLREMVAVTLRNDLTRNQRTALETCITVHMHQKARQFIWLQENAWLPRCSHPSSFRPSTHAIMPKVCMFSAPSCQSR